MTQTHSSGSSMVLDDDTCRRIAERARTLDERLEHAREFPVISSRDAEPILQRWADVVAGGERDLLFRRLAWDRLDGTLVRAAIVAPVPEDWPLPSWVMDLRDLLAEASGVDLSAELLGFIIPGSSVPFEDVFAPIVVAARRRLQRTAGDDLRLLDDVAIASLERYLLERLVRIGAETLQLVFSRDRASSVTGIAGLLARVGLAEPEEAYRAFVHRMWAGALIDALAEFPVLARLLVTVVKLWVEAGAEFLRRLSADMDEIAVTFGGEASPGQVRELLCNLSDPHNDGRSAFVVGFASGVRVVYKPRSLAPEASWFGLLAWLNEHGSPLRMRSLATLERDGYGWIEFADHEPCLDAAQARRYFARTGMTLCLVYALGGNDIHFENIIASGEQPIIVDLETIMHPLRLDGDGGPGSLNGVVSRARYESVVRTGMLPQWIAKSGGRAVDTSALGAVREVQTTRPQPTWVDINTDTMRQERTLIAAPSSGNAAMLAGKPLSPNDYVDAIESGFRAMYELLVQHREALLADDGPLAVMRDLKVRFIHRGTGVYYAVLERANRPECLRDGLRRSIEIDAIARAQALQTSRPAFWPLIGEERRSLEQADIPYFLVGANNVDLVLPGGNSIPGSFAETCFDGVTRRLRGLGPGDLGRQLGYVRATMQARVARHGDMARVAVDEDWDGLPHLTREELIDEAEEIAHAIGRDALGDVTSGVTWITVRYDFRMERFHLEVADNGLYEGAGGIALFLAALDTVTGDTSHGALARAAVVPVVEVAQHGDPGRMADEIGIGGGSGIGSLVYVFTRLGAMLRDPKLLDDARKLAMSITPDRIRTDGTFDVIGGAAGALLGLLALYRETGDEEALARARACGDHLLRKGHTVGPGVGAWPSPSGVPLAGFAHGAAGIAYALLKLFTETSDERYREAALGGIGYEGRLFDQGVANWPDLRQGAGEGPHQFAPTWCNGGSGIGLARLGGLAACDSDAIRADIEAAAEVALRAGTGGVDHLCCGNLGRADILHEMGYRLDREDLVSAAQSRVAGCVQRKRRTGAYRLWWDTGGGIALPGFFQGTSGIGYALLRAASPGILPSVLLWE